jgi:outer membrane protein insertion porin family
MGMLVYPAITTTPQAIAKGATITPFRTPESGPNWAFPYQPQLVNAKTIFKTQSLQSGPSFLAQDPTPEAAPSPATPATETPPPQPETEPKEQPKEQPATPTSTEPKPSENIPTFQPPAPGSANPSVSEPSPPTTGNEPRVLVSEVAIVGGNPELEQLVYNVIRTKPGRTTTRSQLQEDVNAIYATGFFGNVKVSPEDTPLGVKVTFQVQPNPTFKTVAIDTVPASDKARILPDKVVQETFGEQYGKILNLRDLQEGIKKINEWYSSNGYDLAQIVGSPKIGEDGTVTLVIAEGIVQNIQIRFFNAEDEPAEGRTRDFIVTREMQLKPGDVFNRNLAQTDLQRIYGLGLFEDARLSFTPGTDPREVIVNVDVVEGNTGSIAAGAGISSTSGLFGTLSYQEKNLGGNAQTLGTEFQLGERELLFDVSFTDPWIAGDPYRTSYSVNGFRRRTISLVYDGNNSSIRTLNGFDSPRVVRTGLGVNFSRPLAKDVFSIPDWRLSTGFLYQHVVLENSSGDVSSLSAPINGFGEQLLAFNQGGIDDLFILSFGASQDNRNSPLQPTSGSVTRINMEQSVPLSSNGIIFNRVRGSYSYYIPVDWLNLTSFGFTESTQPQTIAFNIQGGTVFGDLPPYEAYIVGGSNSVRGYAEGELGNGRSYVQATAEYRFPIISAVGGALFFDYGSTLGSDYAVPGIPSVIRGLPGQGYGYGIGVRIQSPVGPIRIDYGINEQGGSRVNFGIGEKF